MDIVFINPSTGQNYQNLKSKYVAIEPPTWSLLLAESMRNFGFTVSIIDANAEELSNEKIYERIKKLNPRVIAFVVYGQNVNAGTTNMEGALKISTFLKKKENNLTIAYFGSYVQALPVKCLKEEKSIDMVFTNEGVYALKNILKLESIQNSELHKIKGIAFRDKDKVFHNKPEVVVPAERMDIDLPGYAWDLLPYRNRPLDLYRSPMWHAEYDDEKRSPYAALQTSLGCQFKCSFCMINLINRNDSEDIGVSSNYSKMRFWSPNFIIKEFEKLIKMGVKTIRITDEMFLLNPKYYLPLCRKLTELNNNDSLRMWAYSRIDTVKNPEVLSLVRKAGIKWLCLGIESGDKKVRLEVSKGKFEDVDVKKVIKQVHEADIDVMANYMFGLPGDDNNTIKKTYDLSLELCTSGWNTYAAMALPGSLLYKEAVEKGLELPKSYSGYSFHAYDTVCLPTEKLKAWEILKLRDEAFISYHTNPKFLERIQSRFGDKAIKNIKEMSKIKLNRKIVDEKGNN
ncbi:B12-binding domain-containing radical SAM protein [Candidatus Pelagibacter sp.]|jgi:anaerobic magnesium-protoporphyrin IX monomethyl ester cyclase|nr:B12-binding domain-containing radical SAM protein [Candidatus Pelagibacter sp.]